MPFPQAQHMIYIFIGALELLIWQMLMMTKLRMMYITLRQDETPTDTEYDYDTKYYNLWNVRVKMVVIIRLTDDEATNHFSDDSVTDEFDKRY